MTTCAKLFIVAFLFSTIGTLRAVAEVELPDSKDLIVPILARSMDSVKSMEIEYTCEIAYSDRIKQLDPNVTSERITYIYKQKDGVWSCDITKTLNTGVERRFRFFSDGKVYKHLAHKNRSLTITDSSSVKNQARWWNPLFEAFSFLYETQYYSDQMSPSLNQVDPFSPLPCDLSALAAGKTPLPPLISDSAVIDPSGGTSLSFKTMTPGDTGKMLSNFTLYFDSSSQLLPSKMEKRDASGALVIEVEATDYKSYGLLQFPQNVSIKRYLEGKVDAAIKIKVDKLKFNDPSIVINDIDPSEASRIDDQLNKVNIQPDLFE